ncbi:sensor histidine kinase [Fodinicurvata sediminis]|uniref:sensor histidine kinase n=1 Tax=Fodinicurvata sediminis TaxID=1121832 RepID=UPI0003B5101D|nr:HAMP domain-containing sensor histidine kinase [Fodinicurvata sediminis]
MAFHGSHASEEETERPEGKGNGRTPRRFSLPPLHNSLSARLLLLTIAFVMLAEVLIFAPSVANFRQNYLEERLATAHLAVLSLEATPDLMIDDELTYELLSHVPAESVMLYRPGRTPSLTLAMEGIPEPEAVYDLREAGFFTLIGDALMTLLRSEDRRIELWGVSPKDNDSVVRMVLMEGPLCEEMWAFAWRILGLSLLISVITAALVYVTLLSVLVRPMRRITENMISFRQDPEDESRIIRPSDRQDEIGLAERQLRDLQTALRASLHRKTRLAAIGVAATKINHDLRNILSTAQLSSDSLAESEDPNVRRAFPKLMQTLDRAVGLCSHILNFAREGPIHLEIAPLDLQGLLDEVGTSLQQDQEDERDWQVHLPDSLNLNGDRQQLYRVFMNLAHNAYQAGATRVEVQGQVEDNNLCLDIGDNGPGLAPRTRERLFQPFAASARSGGTGLGLAIAREILRAHGGDIRLLRSDAQGTSFRLTLPLSANGNGPAH